MLKQSCFTDFISAHSFEEFEQVYAVYDRLQAQPKNAEETDELFHAAVIAWQNALGGHHDPNCDLCGGSGRVYDLEGVNWCDCPNQSNGQLELEPENEIENRQVMDL